MRVPGTEPIMSLSWELVVLQSHEPRCEHLESNKFPLEAFKLDFLLSPFLRKELFHDSVVHN